MKYLLLALALVVCAVATQDCGPLQRLKVKTQWVKAYSTLGKEREAFGRQVWLSLLEDEPKVADFLGRVRVDNVYSPEFGAHMVRVFGGLDICISLLGDEATFTSQLSHLRDQHNERAIPHEYFHVMGKALLRAISKHVSHFDQDAWSSCFKVIADGITKGLTDE